MTTFIVICIAIAESFSRGAYAQLPAPAVASSPAATVKVDGSAPVGISHFLPGYTFDQCTLRADLAQCGRKGIDAQAAAAARDVLSGVGPHYANVQLYGWGSSNPEPEPGKFDLSSLRARLDIIRETHGTPVITLCCSPDWMAGGDVGSSYSKLMYSFPKPEHWDAYAELAARVAAENQDVQYFQVWNELKGLYAKDGSFQRWDYESYTAFYNKVFDAVKRVRPDAKIGGPYPPIRAWRIGKGPSPSGVRVAALEIDRRGLEAVEYWLRNKRGADFIALDGSNRTREPDSNAPRNEFDGSYEACDVFAKVVDWIRSLDEREYPGARSLPIAWSEWYAFPGPGGEAASSMAQCLIPTIRSGAFTAMIWGAEGHGDTGQSFPLGLWTGTVGGGGKPTDFYFIARGLIRHFPPGTRLYRTETQGPVGALSSDRTTMLVNQTSSLLEVRLNGRLIRLKPHEVVFAATR